jgi:hypothetical protein
VIAPKATLQRKCDERAEGKGFAIKIYDEIYNDGVAGV